MFESGLQLSSSVWPYKQTFKLFEPRIPWLDDGDNSVQHKSESEKNDNASKMLIEMFPTVLMGEYYYNVIIFMISLWCFLKPIPLSCWYVKSFGWYIELKDIYVAHKLLWYVNWIAFLQQWRFLLLIYILNWASLCWVPEYCALG